MSALSSSIMAARSKIRMLVDDNDNDDNFNDDDDDHNNNNNNQNDNSKKKMKIIKNEENIMIAATPQIVVVESKEQYHNKDKKIEALIDEPKESLSMNSSLSPMSSSLLSAYSSLILTTSQASAIDGVDDQNDYDDESKDQRNKCRQYFIHEDHRKQQQQQDQSKNIKQRQQQQQKPFSSLINESCCNCKYNDNKGVDENKNGRGHLSLNDNNDNNGNGNDDDDNINDQSSMIIAVVVVDSELNQVVDHHHHHHHQDYHDDDDDDENVHLLQRKQQSFDLQQQNRQQQQQPLSTVNSENNSEQKIKTASSIFIDHNHHYQNGQFDTLDSCRNRNSVNCSGLTTTTKTLRDNSNHRRRRRRRCKKHFQKTTKTITKWKNDNKFWLKFWSYQQQQQQFQPKQQQQKSIINNYRQYSYCYYHYNTFFYYPFRLTTTTTTTDLQPNIDCIDDDDFNSFSPSSSSSLTSLISSESLNNQIFVQKAKQTYPQCLYQKLNSFTFDSLQQQQQQSKRNKTESNNILIDTIDNLSMNQQQQQQQFIKDNNNESSIVNLNRSSPSLSIQSPSSTTTICLSTIMEILPLILLLTMGVIISTTCAKYRFKQSIQSIPTSSSSLSSIHQDYLLQANNSSSTAATTSSLSDQLNDDNDDNDEYLNRMMNDEESPSLSVLSSEQQQQRPLQYSMQFQQQQSKLSTKLSNSAQQQQQQQQQLFAQLAHQYSAMHLQWLSNSSVTCNDGTRAGYYIRQSPNGSKRWLIFLEGGWYCMSKQACDQRWYKMRDFMTSFRWSQYKTVSGILSSSPTINPYWWNANHVFIPYCSSDIWSGDQPANHQSSQMTMSFLGSRIIDEVIGELIRSPKYQFLHAKFVLLAGSSAGAAGVMINLDRVAKQIADSGSMADVRGLADSGWIMDMDDQQQSSSKLSSSSTAPCTDGFCPPTETIRGAYRLWNSRVPESCAKQYPQEPWRCFFGYRLYPTLSTPLFIVQFQYDEFQLYMDGIVTGGGGVGQGGHGIGNGGLINDQERIQYIRSLSEQMIKTLTNVSACFIPSCMAHILLTKLDWYKVSIDHVTLPEALNCWEQIPVNYNQYYYHNHHHQYGHHHNHHHHHQHQHYHPHQQRENYPINHRSIFNTKLSRFPSAKLSPLSDQYFGSTMDSKTSDQQQQHQNELLQFYSPPSSLSGSTGGLSVNNNNFLNYLTLKNLKNQSLDGYYSNQRIDSIQIPIQDKEGGSKFLKPSSSSSTMTISTLLDSNNNQINSRTSADSSMVNHNHQQNQKNKRKKRKRRKGHHHHRKISTTTSTTTISTLIDSMIQNDDNRYYHQEESSKSLLHTYYQPQSSLSNRNSYWNPSFYPQQQHHELRICHYRLIDKHQYPERNHECPRLQFNHNQPSTTSSNTNDNRDYHRHKSYHSIME